MEKPPTRPPHNIQQNTVTLVDGKISQHRKKRVTIKVLDEVQGRAPLSKVPKLDGEYELDEAECHGYHWPQYLVRHLLHITIILPNQCLSGALDERWGTGVETQKNVRGEIGGWGRVLYNEPYAPSLSTIYDGA